MNGLVCKYTFLLDQSKVSHSAILNKKNLGHDFSTHINNEHFTKPEKFSMNKNWTLFFTYTFWYVTMRFYHAQR